MKLLTEEVHDLTLEPDQEEFSEEDIQNIYLQDGDFKVYLIENEHPIDVSDYGYYARFDMSDYNIKLKKKKLKYFYKIFIQEDVLSDNRSYEVCRYIIFRFDDDTYEDIHIDTNGNSICSWGGRGDIFKEGYKIEKLTWSKFSKIDDDYIDVVGFDKNKIICVIGFEDDLFQKEEKEKQFSELRKFIEDNDALYGKYPYSKTYSIVCENFNK